MKNFPHQFSDLERLTAALHVARETIAKSAARFRDDEVYGAALARAGVYKFRQGGGIEALLRQEREKPRQRRGTETAAREMRRTLLLLGFLKVDGLNYAISSRGYELLKAEDPVVRAALWREALLSLELADADGHISHPYRILLRLVSDNPGIETKKLLLALEARDDTEEEYARITGLLDVSAEDLPGELGIGESNAANAVKILPSLAAQVGDIRRTNRQSYPAARFEIAEDAIEPVTEKDQGKTTARLRGAAKRVTNEEIANIPDFKPSVGVIVDLSSAVELRKKRTKKHQELVRSLARLLSESGYDLFENPFDCLAQKRDRALLIEAKTLDGSPLDERRQSERAIGQLFGYRHFDLPRLDDVKIHSVIAFDQRPTDATLDFLRSLGLTVIWRTDLGWSISTAGEDVEFDPDAIG